MGFGLGLGFRATLSSSQGLFLALAQCSRVSQDLSGPEWCEGLNRGQPRGRPSVSLTLSVQFLKGQD